MAKREHKSRKPAPFPSKARILEFIEQSPGKVGRREIARAFAIRGPARADLRRILGEMAANGMLARDGRRGARKAGTLPKVAVIEIVGCDIDGELLARPAVWRDDGAPPPIMMAPSVSGKGAGPALGVGDRVLARLVRGDDGSYEARTIRRIEVSPRRVLGIYAEVAGQGRLVPTDKRARHEYVVERADSRGARPGELIAAEIKGAGHRGASLGLKRAVIRERLGRIDEPRAISLIAIHDHGIPTDFADDALAAAREARPERLGSRVDLRDLPLVTIDPEDARDHDDAVWAAPDDDPGNPGGWLVVVAIADVAHYVRSGKALDRAARERGNSVYFPDRVVPMLPERLSNHLCSLRQGADRPCLAVRMWFDARGTRLRHRFLRAFMRSAASLTYSQAQSARDGAPDDKLRALMGTVIEPLYGAYGALRQARARRQPLEIDLPERRITLDDAGRVTAIAPRQRHDAHRLVEEFMIQANVAAAETLAERRRACVYRVHEPPDPEKVRLLRDYLASLGLRLKRGPATGPGMFNAVLREAAGTPRAQVISEVVLRTQSQAVYTPDNLGHYGLALRRYAHFTSPIRRYADILVHRALAAALDLGGGEPGDGEPGDLREISRHISHTERRAALAERDSKDRYLAAFMADRIGATFTGRITGVTRFGLFITLDESGADGLVPMRNLADDYYVHDQRRHALVGKRTANEYRLGTAVEVRLAEADPMTGGIKLDLLTRPERGQRGRQHRTRR